MNETELTAFLAKYSLADLVAYKELTKPLYKSLLEYLIETKLMQLERDIDKINP